MKMKINGLDDERDLGEMKYIRMGRCCRVSDFLTFRAAASTIQIIKPTPKTTNL
jgi:hypothetical protein